MGKRESENYHKRTEEAWDMKHEEGWHRKQSEEPFLKNFIEERKEEIGQEILDIGSGRGRNLIPLAERGYNVTGLDISKEGLRRTKERLLESELEADLVQGKTSELPFEDKSFDFVFSIGTIHHNKWEDIEKSFKEANRVLRDDKYFLFQGRSVKDNDRPKKQVEDFGFTAVDTEGNKEGVIQHYFTEEELIKLAGENGFEIVAKPVEEIQERKEEPDRKRARFWVVFQKKENV